MPIPIRIVTLLMRISRVRALAIAGVTIGCLGCDKVTGPQARDIVERTEKRLLSGDYATLQRGLRDLTDVAMYYGYGNHNNNRHIPIGQFSILRDGQLVSMMATVVERVYLPQPGSGGRPSVSRWVLAWEVDSTDRATDRWRLVVLISSDTVSSLAVPGIQPTNGTRRFERSGFVLNVDPGDRRAWYSTEGALSITGGALTGPCPYTGTSAKEMTGIAEISDPMNTFSCDTRAYSVSVASLLERGDPSNRHSLDNLIPATGTLTAATQMVPGVRFETQCSAVRRGPDVCWDYLAFWRDNAQFAANFGIDLAQMRQTSSNNTLWQVLSPGTGPDYRVEPRVYDLPVRYTISTAAGEPMVRRDKATVHTDSLLHGLPIQDIPQRVGSRVVMITPAIHFDRGANPYSMAVIEIVFLPFVTARR